MGAAQRTEKRRGDHSLPFFRSPFLELPPLSESLEKANLDVDSTMAVSLKLPGMVASFTAVNTSICYFDTIEVTVFLKLSDYHSALNQSELRCINI